MKKIILASVFTFLQLAGNTVSSQTFNYSSASVSYFTFSESDDGFPETLTGNGFSISSSIDISNNLVFTASYSKDKADVTIRNQKIESNLVFGTIGLLYYRSINNYTDFIVGVDIINGALDTIASESNKREDDADGSSIYFAIRMMTANNMEINGSISRTVIEKTSVTDIGVGISYYLNKSFSLDGDYSFDSNGKSFSFGITSYFRH